MTHNNVQWSDQADDLLRHLREACAQRSSGQRYIVALSGAPGSGKSTLAAWLVERMNQSAAESAHRDDESAMTAALVPMDGFHLDNAILDARNQRFFKGAPHTFDVGGLYDLLQRLKQTDRDVYVPVFDRSADLSRCAASVITAEQQLIIVEGNYLMLNDGDWPMLRECFDYSVMLDVPLSLLEQRLVQRWLDHGLDENTALKKARDNDIPNAKTVINRSADTHFSLRQYA